MPENIDQKSRIAGDMAAVQVSKSGNPAFAPVVAALSDADPADLWQEIAPNDGTVYDPAPVAIYVGGAGDISLTASDDNVSVFSNVPAGTLLPLRPKKIRATGTTATLIVGLFRSEP